MIFLQGQALDNRSDDPFVLDGVVVTASTPGATDAIDLTSRIRMRGHADNSRDTIVTRLHDMVAVEILTEDVDIVGRPAPLLATLPLADIDSDQLGNTVARLARDAGLIGRHFNAEALTKDLTAWRASPKATGGLLTRLRRRFLNGLKWPLRKLSGLLVRHGR